MLHSDAHPPMPAEHRKVLVACGLGALFEWYDFYLYAVLAPVLVGVFFAEPGAGVALALLALAAGFVVRPLGALVFGRLGDLIGRKYTFLVTLLLMGGATFAIGVLPGHLVLGWAAPVLLVLLRLLQGLAIGGEYGGVATYVAEHAPPGRLGFYTGWIQATASLGLLLALLVTTGLRSLLGETAFVAWGWRLPFVLSIVLLAIGLWVRLSLQESPPFARLKRAGGASRAPVSEAFARWTNLRLVLVVLLGLVAGQAVVWYTGQFQALLFMTLQLKVDATRASLMLCAALALGAPLFLAFAVLSDRIGRKPIILAGCLLAALAYLPLFEALTVAANPALAQARAQVPAVLAAEPADCVWRLQSLLVPAPGSGCDAARHRLADRGVRYTFVQAQGAAVVTVGQERIAVERDDVATHARLDAALDRAGYPSGANPAQVSHVRVVGILFLLVVLAAMVYGPIAALLVETFPMRVRCLSVGVPYHIGNGWIGGLLPSAVLAIGTLNGDMFSGLWVPIVVALASCAIGLVFVREPKGVDPGEA